MLLDLKQRGFMVTKILKRITEFCSYKAPEGTTRNSRKAGFTIVELMVVIIIVNVLAGIGVPKCTDLIEKSKQKVDLMKLHLLKDAINRHLYESDMFSVSNAADSTYTKDLQKCLKEGSGAALFIIELHKVMPANYQGKRDAQCNVSELMRRGGFLKDVFDEAGMGAIGDIVAQRYEHPDGKASEIQSNSRFTATTTSNGENKNYVRTYPTNPVFISRALNTSSYYSGTNQYRVAFKIQWTDKKPESHSVEVFIGKEKASDSEGRWDSALLTCQDVCFSTYGRDKGCKKSTCMR